MKQTSLTTRNVFFLIFIAASTFIFSSHLLELAALSRKNELYSHIFFIPLISAYLVYSNRRRIFEEARFSLRWGITGLIAALAIFIAGNLSPGLSRNDFLSAMIFSWAVSVAGGFIAIYGTTPAKAAAFPLAFMTFMIPAPQGAVDAITAFLQSGSTEVAWQLFNLVGAPVQRDGYFFLLPGMNVEVATQCSGIRSSLALFISGVLASHLFLRTWLGRSALMAVIVPIAVLKNGLRIAALTLSGYYIDERMLYGSLHTRGGMVFFAIAVLLAGTAIWFLRGLERKALKKNAAGA